MGEALTGGELLELDGVTKRFPLRSGLSGLLSRGEAPVVHAVEDVTLTIRPGETLAIVGESGSGKTTLGRIAAGLQAPTSGTIRFEGRDVTSPSAAERKQLRRDIQVVFQDPFSSLDPRQAVQDIVREPLDIHKIGTPQDRRARVEALLDRVRVPARLKDARPHELSGGLRQRVGIATALVVNPKLIVADEPLSALDVSVQAEVLELLAELQAERGLAYILISHDLGVVEEVADEVAVMYLGRIVERAPAGELFGSSVHPYTQALLSAVLVADPTVVHEPTRLSGEIPSPIDPPSGCAFRTRCPLAVESCAGAVPELVELKPGHLMACPVEAVLQGARSATDPALAGDSNR
jgi:oligopeptide/dipeptide ABC transporter ATP-binding protein